jgi:hypothetical protein
MCDQAVEYRGVALNLYAMRQFIWLWENQQRFM